ncbi:MAG TPA: PTS sugar transporter subunit IIA [Chthoniobacterales bacterium]|jgi:mannitol/fructose-specific phosphotransferase system IIA component (Ntr-type)
MAISLSDILKERQIALHLKSRSKASALRELVDLFNATGTLRQPAHFLEQVIAREEASSTLAQNGVAFPHARTDLVDEIALAVGRSSTGIPWAANGDRAHLIFLVAVPKQLVNDYLVVVGMLARITKSKERRNALLAAATPAEFIAVLREAPSL